MARPHVTNYEGTLIRADMIVDSRIAIHQNMKNTKIYQIDNGSNKEINFGTIDNWKLLSENTAKIINEIDKTKYDKILTICNDTPFCCL